MRTVLAFMAAGLLACGGGSSSNPPGAPTGVEVDFTAAGVTPASVNVASGGQVQFVNKDTASHQVSSTACPELNTAAMAAGQSTTVGISGTKQCPFVDSLNPSAVNFRGTVNVAPAGSDAGPGY